MDEITKKQACLQIWRQRVAECRGSGMPVAQWCELNGINYKAYYRWHKKVFDAMVEEQRGEPKFTELTCPEPLNRLAATVRIGPAAVDVFAGANTETVAAIVRALTVC